MTKKKNSNIKKNTIKKIDNIESNLEKEILKVLRIVFVVIVFLAFFYLLTLVIVNDNGDDELKETAIQYEEILAGSSFNMRDSEYLVVFYDFTDEDLTNLSSAIFSYGYSENSIRLYTVDMNNGFNSKYVADDKSNRTPESAKDLKINGPTLIRIIDGKVLEYIESADAIIEYLS